MNNSRVVSERKIKGWKIIGEILWSMVSKATERSSSVEVWPWSAAQRGSLKVMVKIIQTA